MMKIQNAKKSVSFGHFLELDVWMIGLLLRALAALKDPVQLGQINQFEENLLFMFT